MIVLATEVFTLEVVVVTVVIKWAGSCSWWAVLMGGAMGVAEMGGGREGRCLDIVLS